MAEYGKMQKVVRGTLFVMLVASLLLAVASNVYAEVPYPKEECTTSCGSICMGSGCCDYDPNRNPPCYPHKIRFIRRCDEYTTMYGCLSGWYCKGFQWQCNLGECC